MEKDRIIGMEISNLDRSATSTDSASPSSRIRKQRFLKSMAARKRDFYKKRLDVLNKCLTTFRTSSVLCQTANSVPERFESECTENITVDTDHGSYCRLEDPPVSGPINGNGREIFFRNLLSEEHLRNVINKKRKISMSADDLSSDVSDSLDFSLSTAVENRTKCFVDYQRDKCMEVVNKLELERDDSIIVDTTCDQESSTSMIEPDFDTIFSEFCDSLQPSVSSEIHDIFKLICHERLADLTTDERLDKSHICENLRLAYARRMLLNFGHIFNVNSSLIAVLCNFLLVHLPVEFKASFLLLLKFIQLQDVKDFNTFIVDPIRTSKLECLNRQFLNIFVEFFDSSSHLRDITTPRRSQRESILFDGHLILISPNIYNKQTTEHYPCKRYEHFKKTIKERLGCVLHEIVFPEFSSKMDVCEIDSKLKAHILTEFKKIKISNPNQRLLLAGWDHSCYLALQMASCTKPDCVLCFAFSNLIHAGIRGDVGDKSFILERPVFFCCGSVSVKLNLTFLKRTIGLMKNSKIGLVIVNGADSQLLINPYRLCFENVTQDFVDKLIMSSVEEFMHEVVLVAPEKESKDDDFDSDYEEHHHEVQEPLVNGSSVNNKPDVVATINSRPHRTVRRSADLMYYH